MQKDDDDGSVPCAPGLAGRPRCSRAWIFAQNYFEDRGLVEEKISTQRDGVLRAVGSVTQDPAASENKVATNPWICKALSWMGRRPLPSKER